MKKKLVSLLLATTMVAGLVAAEAQMVVHLIPAQQQIQSLRHLQQLLTHHQQKLLQQKQPTLILLSM